MHYLYSFISRKEIPCDVVNDMNTRESILSCLYHCQSINIAFWFRRQITFCFCMVFDIRIKLAQNAHIFMCNYVNEPNVKLEEFAQSSKFLSLYRSLIQFREQTHTETY